MRREGGDMMVGVRGRDGKGMKGKFWEVI